MRAPGPIARRGRLAIAALVAALAAVAGAAGCGEATVHSQRCADLCAVEADCAQDDDRHPNFAENECVAACAALERDPEGKKHVDRHAECVRAARAKSRQSCDDVLACP